MAKKPLRSQLNQIRAWVQQGRTDAWIAHQLGVSTSELREFRRRHELMPGDAGGEEADLRDEIEAEIEAAVLAREEEPEPEEPERPEEPAPPKEPAAPGVEGAEQVEPEALSEERRGRRRRRRRGRGRPATLEGTFDHGEREGYGLWLDPAIAENPVYAENWAGHRAVEVQVEPDRITIRRV